MCVYVYVHACVYVCVCGVYVWCVYVVCVCGMCVCVKREAVSTIRCTDTLPHTLMLEDQFALVLVVEMYKGDECS